jgi:asparagine synthase (glutamine-hydrolysing)
MVFLGKNLEMTELYLTFNFVPPPYTFYKDIFKLKPGSFFIISKNEVKFKSYWTLPQRNEKEMIKDRKKVYATFAELFSDSVRLRLRSDVPLGLFLSSGLDSSSILATMSDLGVNPIKSFTVGFTSSTLDETIAAEKLAQYFNSSYIVIKISPNLITDEIT